MVLAHRGNRRAPVLIAELERGLGERALGLAEEVLAPRTERRRVVIEELLLAKPRVRRVSPDGEASARFRPELVLEPRRVGGQRGGRRIGGGPERALRGPVEGRTLRQHRRRIYAQERGAGRHRPKRDVDPFAGDQRWIEIRLRRFDERRSLREALGERGHPLGERRVLAEERVVRATRDRVGVERGLAAPARERTDRALAAQLREDQLAVDSLEGREVAILDRLEAGEPLVIESIALAKAVGAEVTKAMVVLVDARDRRRDRLERVAPVDEVVGELGERRELERLAAVRAELGVGPVRAAAVTAVDRGPRRGRSRGRGPRCRLCGLFVLGFVAEAAHTLAELAEHVGKLPGAEDDQHDRQDEEELRTTDIGHRSLPLARLVRRLDSIPVY